MPLDMGQASEVGLYTTGGGFALLAIRQLYKMLRADYKEVKGSGESDTLLDHYKDLADRYKHEADENAKRADDFALQRNKAIEEVGQLRGEVVSLTRHVEQLQSQIVQLQKTIDMFSEVYRRDDDPQGATNGL